MCDFCCSAVLALVFGGCFCRYPRMSLLWFMARILKFNTLLYWFSEPSNQNDKDQNDKDQNDKDQNDQVVERRGTFAGVW